MRVRGGGGAGGKGGGRGKEGGGGGPPTLSPKTADTTGTWMEGQGHGAGGRSVNGTFGWGGAAGTLGAVDFNIGLRTGLWTQYMHANPAEAYPVREEFLAAMAKDSAAMREQMAS